ncbi:hypothetical protein BDC45DRAFT_307150 [Circinella umbellata]|nr:hypothetical protein BDC45DRAFT_307150 [Circinella umbellata]
MLSTTFTSISNSSDDDIRTLKAQLAAQSETIRRLKQDMQALNNKYVSEIERAAETLYQKDMVEQELEELSCQLFEQANDMVAQEKRAKHALENQLRKTQKQLLTEQSQVRELRLQQQQDIVLQKSASSTATFSINNNNSITSSSNNSEKPPCSKTKALTEYYSPATVETFKQFVKKSIYSTCSTPHKQQQHVPLIKIHHQFSFLKMCQEDDIEPCLRFGLNSRWSIKKIIDYLLRQPCFIEKIDSLSTPLSADHCGVPSSAYNRPLLWERWIDHHHQPAVAITMTNKTEPLLPMICSACGEATTELNYRFRLDMNEDWYRIDRYCRDRLVAVCEFYVFIRNIYMGFYGDKDVHILYEETVRLRLQIFYARMGTMRDIDPPPLINSKLDREDEEDNKSFTGSVSTVSTASTSDAPLTPTQEGLGDDNNNDTKEQKINYNDNDVKESFNNSNNKKQHTQQPKVRSRSWTISSNHQTLE